MTSTKSRIILTGGSGFLGTSLAEQLVALNHEVVILTRHPHAQTAHHSIREIHWDAKSPGLWTSELDGATAIINFVGKSVDCRKTPQNKKEILDSRINSVRALASAWHSVPNPPKIWLQTGTAHIYGDTADEILTESSPIGQGFAPQVGTAWEAALNNTDLPNCRKVIFRISFVMGRSGGALRTLLRLIQCFLGGPISTGQQYISWIHIADLNALFLRALNNESMHGTYIATSPNPVTNKQFMQEIRRAAHRPWSPPTPEFLVRIGACFLGTDPELALLGRRCVPKRLMDEGFEFRFPQLRPALDDLIR